MTERTIFLEMQVLDAAATTPPYSRRTPFIILDYAAPHGVQGITLVQTLNVDTMETGEVALPFDATEFGIYEKGLENYASINASSYEALEQQIQLAIAQPVDRAYCRSYIRTGPGPTPGH